MKNVFLFPYTKVSCWTRNACNFGRLFPLVNKKIHYMTHSCCDNRCTRSHQWWFPFYHSYIIFIDKEKSNYGSRYSSRTRSTAGQ